MGSKINIYDHIRSLNKLVIEYIEDGERKSKKGKPEEVIEIYEKINQNPDRMHLEFIDSAE